MNIKEVADYLRENKYLFEWNGHLHVTSKFTRDLKRAEESKNLPAILDKNSKEIVIQAVESTKDRFKRFIAEAEVPYRIKTDDGREFTANAYSIAAERVFNRALKDGINYQALVMSTKLYYKAVGFRQKISNYFVQGTWESEYDEFVKKMKDGSIVDHINGQIKGKFGRDL